MSFFDLQELKSIVEKHVRNESSSTVVIVCRECADIVVIDYDYYACCEKCGETTCPSCGGMDHCDGCGGMYCGKLCHTEHISKCENMVILNGGSGVDEKVEEGEQLSNESDESEKEYVYESDENYTDDYDSVSSEE